MPHSLRQKLHRLLLSNPEELNLYLLAERISNAREQRFHHISHETSIKDMLQGKTIIEHPIVWVASCNQKEQYLLVQEQCLQNQEESNNSDNESDQESDKDINQEVGNTCEVIPNQVANALIADLFNLGAIKAE